MVQSLPQSDGFRILFNSPELSEVQRSGFHLFLKKGIAEELSKISRIQVKNVHFLIEIVIDAQNFRLVHPENTYRDCTLKMKSYTCKLYVQTTIFCKDKLSGELFYQTKPEWVLLADLPIMTKRGHFVINGSPRVVVHQIGRSPGIYFKKVLKLKKDVTNTARFYGDIIPRKGVWVRLQINKKGEIDLKLKKSKKVRAEMVQKCLQVLEKEELFLPFQKLFSGKQRYITDISNQSANDSSMEWPRTNKIIPNSEQNKSRGTRAKSHGLPAHACAGTLTIFQKNRTSTIKLLKRHSKKLSQEWYQSVHSIKRNANPLSIKRNANPLLVRAQTNSFFKSQTSVLVGLDFHNCFYSTNQQIQTFVTVENTVNTERFLLQKKQVPQSSPILKFFQGRKQFGENTSKDLQLKSDKEAFVNVYTSFYKNEIEDTDNRISRFFVKSSRNSAKSSNSPLVPPTGTELHIKLPKLHDSSRSHVTSTIAQKALLQRGSVDRIKMKGASLLKALPSFPEIDKDQSYKKTKVSKKVTKRQNFSGNLERIHEYLYQLFKRSDLYDLSLVGREKINTKFGISVIGTQLTALDIKESINWLSRLKAGKEEVDDIDHSENRRVRTSSELIQTQFEIGCTRLKNMITKKVRNYKNEEIKAYIGKNEDLSSRKRPPAHVMRGPALYKASVPIVSTPGPLLNTLCKTPFDKEVKLRESKILDLAQMFGTRALDLLVARHEWYRICGVADFSEISIFKSQAKRFACKTFGNQVLHASENLFCLTFSKNAGATFSYACESIYKEKQRLINSYLPRIFVKSKLGLQMTPNKVSYLAITKIYGSWFTKLLHSQGRYVHTFSSLSQSQPRAMDPMTFACNNKGDAKSKILRCKTYSFAQASTQPKASLLLLPRTDSKLRSANYVQRSNQVNYEKAIFDLIDNIQTENKWGIYKVFGGKQSWFHRLHFRNENNCLIKKKKTVDQVQVNLKSRITFTSINPYFLLKQSLCKKADFAMCNQASNAKSMFLQATSFCKFLQTFAIKSMYKYDHQQDSFSSLYFLGSGTQQNSQYKLYKKSLLIQTIKQSLLSFGTEKANFSLVFENSSIVQNTRDSVPINLFRFQHGQAEINPQAHNTQNMQNGVFEKLFPAITKPKVLHTKADLLHQELTKPKVLFQLCQNEVVRLGSSQSDTKDLPINNLSVSELFSTKPVNGALREFFSSSPLSQYMDQTNPLAEITHKRRISSLGVGGVSRESAGMTIRGIHPTHYGRICPIETPEGKNAGLVNSLAFYAKINTKGFIETPYYPVIKGQIQHELGFSFYSARKESRKGLYIAPNDIEQSKSKLLGSNICTLESIPVRVADNLLDLFKKVNPYQVDCIGISPAQILSVATSLIPFLEHNDANRALMGSNMQRQAVPLMISERPLVGTGLEARVLAESGHLVQSKVSGFVSTVGAHKVVVEHLLSLPEREVSLCKSKPKAMLAKSKILHHLRKPRSIDLRSCNARAHKGALHKLREQSSDIEKVPVTQNCIRSTTLFRLRPSVKENKSLYLLPIDSHLHDFVTHVPTRRKSRYEGSRWASPTLVGRYPREAARAICTKVCKYQLSLPELSFTNQYQARLLPVTHSITTFSRSNQETGLVQKPLIEEGDWVQKGDMLSDCSAGHKGELSVGKNMLIAYIPWQGYNFEDAIVISDRLVKEQLYTSLHIERYTILVNDFKDKVVDTNEWFTSNLPGVDPKRILHLHKSGVPRVGTILKEGDILVGKIKYSKKKPSTPHEKLVCDILGEQNFSVQNSSLYVPKGVHEARVLTYKIKKRFDKALKNNLRPAGAPKIIHIFLGEKRNIQIGDKMSGRHGNKGIVSTILPKQDMPYLADGRPIDILLNPLGVPSRMNVGQVFECLLGLASTYLRQNFKVTAFDEVYGADASQSLVFLKLYQARLQSGQNWLFQIHFPGKTRLTDGRSGECFDQWITVGRAYMLKLIHMVNEKIHARAIGPYALVTQQPLKGRAHKGGQRLGEMEVWAVEGFGAAYILQELLTKKSDDSIGRKEILKAMLPKPSSFLDSIDQSSFKPGGSVKSERVRTKIHDSSLLYTSDDSNVDFSESFDHQVTQREPHFKVEEKTKYSIDKDYNPNDVLPPTLIPGNEPRQLQKPSIEKNPLKKDVNTNERYSIPIQERSDQRHNQRQVSIYLNFIQEKEENKLVLGQPDIFKVLICELQALCLDVGVYSMKTESFQRQFLGFFEYK